MTPTKKLNGSEARVNIGKPEPSESQKFLLIQLADLFAGMGAYSRGQFERFSQWQAIQDGKQSPLFSSQDGLLVFSRRETERFSVMADLNRKCKDNKLQIAFESTKGFESYNNRSFINFWVYRPQSKFDKAPLKKRRISPAFINE